MITKMRDSMKLKKGKIFLVVIFLFLTFNVLRMFYFRKELRVIKRHYKTSSGHKLNVNKNQYFRTRTIKKLCQKYGLDKDNDLASLKASKRFKTVIVDDKHKTLFCYVPKIASGNWKRIFLVLKGEYRDMYDIETNMAHKESLLKTLGNSTLDEIRRKTKRYRSYVVVREPMERLLSAYVNKIYYDYTGKFYRLFGKKIMKYSNRVLETEEKQNISFAEFVEFLTNAPAKEAFEIHWERMYKLCHPCLINYSFIGKYENLFHDAKTIIESVVRNDNSIVFPTYASQTNTKTLMASYFSQINEKQLKKLIALYELDYLLFDYPKPVHLFKVVKKDYKRSEDLVRKH